MAVRTYKLELTNPDTIEKVSFGPRKLGDVGRDILIVKATLGQIIDYSSLINEGDTNPSFEELDGWFDCATATKITDREAATFDRKMQTYLTKFQLDNQFYILSYLFTKFAIAENLEKIENLPNRNFETAEAYQAMKQLQAGIPLPGGATVSVNASLPGPLAILTGFKVPANGIPAVDSDNIASYRKYAYIASIIHIMIQMYDVRLGTLDEATLAVLHGWRPRTRVGAKSYYHDQRVFQEYDGAYDLAILGLYESFVSGLLTQKLEDSDDIIAPRPGADFGSYKGSAFKGLEFLEKYKEQVSAAEDLRIGDPEYVMKSVHFGALKYKIKEKEEASHLYSTFVEVTNSQPRGTSADNMSSKDYSDAFNRVFEPDPLTDPDPFVVSGTEIGFFNQTDYTLANLPPMPPPPGSTAAEISDYRQAIRELEDRALTRVLEHYGKPHVWFHKKNEQKFQSLYGSILAESVSPFHDGSLNNGDTYCLTTRENAAKFQKSLSQYVPYERVPDAEMPSGPPGHAEEYIRVDYSNYNENIVWNEAEHPLIRFIEFRTPSLRVGDSYRAKFTINRRKLELISDGLFLETPQEAPNANDEEGPNVSPLAEDASITALITGCPPGTVSEEDERRRYEEYKSLASKQKRKIARILREKQVETYDNKLSAEMASVNLGVFGNANLGLGSFQTQSDSFRDSLIDNLGRPILDVATLGLLDAFNDPNNASKVENPDFKNFKQLKITFQELKSLAPAASKNLKEAYETCLKDKIKFTNNDKDSVNFNGAQESIKLGAIPAELKKLISSDPNGKNFNFGESSAGMTLSGLGGSVVNPTSMTIEINFKISSGGMIIRNLKAGGKEIKITKARLKKSAPTLSRPRTVAYLAQVVAMADGALSFSQLLSDGLGSCNKMGIGKKGLAFLMKYTLDLRGKFPKEFNPLHIWLKENVEDPVKAWQKASKKNWDDTWSAKFGEDEILAAFGDQCRDLKTFFRHFIDRFSLVSLLCDFFKCLKLPAVNLQIPNFYIPPLPNMKIFKWWWGLVKFMINRFSELLTRFICAFIKMILDFLRFPFCKEQMRDQLFGQAAAGTPGLQKALVDGLTDINLRAENVEKSKDLIDQMGFILTGEDLCRILKGEPIDAATMNMILRLAERLEIDEIDNEETLRAFFETISIFLPESFCDNLSEISFIAGESSCAETSDLLSQIRRRMLANDATDEEIQQAIDMAHKNLMDQAKAFEVFGKEGLNGIIPPALDFGNPDALISEMPEALATSVNRTGRQIFESAKTSYVSSLTSYGPAFYLNYSKLPNPSEASYGEVSSIIVETILHNLKIYNAIGERTAGAPATEVQLRQQLHVLYQIYQLRPYHTPYETRHRLYPATYIQPGDEFNKTPQTDVVSDGYSLVTWDQRQEQSEVGKLFLNPIGYMENGYFLADPDNEDFSGPTQTSTFGGLSLGEMKELDDPDSALYGFSFTPAYKLLKKAIDASSDPIANSQDLNNFLLGRINVRLNELQSTLMRELENTVKPVDASEHLAIIRDLLSFSYESEVERRRTRSQNAGEEGETELIDSSRVKIFDMDGGQSSYQAMNLTLDMNRNSSVVNLYEFASTGQNRAASNTLDPYNIVIEGANPLFREKETFSYCDTIPGPGTDESSLSDEDRRTQGALISDLGDIPPGLYTRAELLSRMIWEKVNQKVGNRTNEMRNSAVQGSNGLFIGIFDDAREQAEVREELDVLNKYDRDEGKFLRDHIYFQQFPNITEGIFEQIFFALRNSRIYDEEGYFQEFIRRASGEVYKTSDGCYKNRYNISELSILSFEKIVTDEFEAQVQSELSKPENKPENLDFDDLGPFEKAIQNVCLIGFVRICIVELILKGALAYSVWDVEGVCDEPFMRDFVRRFVLREIQARPSLNGKWEKIVARITGIDQPKFAIDKLVAEQFLKVKGVSKNLFLNDFEGDYFNWFLKYAIPQTEVSRKPVPLAGPVHFSDGSISLMFVDEDGNTRISSDREDWEVEPSIARVSDFIWQHPLLDPENIISTQISEANFLDPASLSRNLLRGNNAFFHIEHCIEVTGPLAHLESIVLPARQIVEATLTAEPDRNSPNYNPANESFITSIPYVSNQADRGNPNFERDSGLRLPLNDNGISRLSVYDARRRFVNLAHLSLDDYDFRNRPRLPGDAIGTSIEDVNINTAIDHGDFNAGHEIFHIKDFVEGIRSCIKETDLEKYFYHLRCLLHFDEAPDEAPGGPNRNTHIQEAEGYAQAIKKTPIRFIVRKRQVVDFTRDIISHNHDIFHPRTAALFSSHNYIEKLCKRNVEALHGLTAAENAAAFNMAQTEYQRAAEAAAPRVDSRPDKFYVVAMNGEDILRMGALGLDVDNPSGIAARKIADYFNRSMSVEACLGSPIAAGYIKKETGVKGTDNQYEYADNRSKPWKKYSALNIYTNMHNFENIWDFDNQFAHGHDDLESPTPLGLPAVIHHSLWEKHIEKVPIGQSTTDAREWEADFLDFDQTGAGAQDERIFSTGPVGHVMAEASWQDALDAAQASTYIPEDGVIPEVQRETWVETIYTFRDKASIISGLLGSFNIGELSDRHFNDFRPSQEVAEYFDDVLSETLESLGWDYNTKTFRVHDTKSEWLTQYGKVFYKRTAGEEHPAGYGAPHQAGIMLARPMGIDKFTNFELTRHFHTMPGTVPDPRDLGLNESSGFYSRPFVNSQGPWLDRPGGGDGDDVPENFPRHPEGGLYYNPENVNQQGRMCKMLHETPFKNNAGRLTWDPSNLLPPNVYKIPMRILVTQIFQGDNQYPSEVYARVVLPSFISNPGPADNAFTSRTAKLNNAIKKLAEEYVEFVANYRATHPSDDAADLTFAELREIEPNFPEFTTDWGHGSPAAAVAPNSGTARHRNAGHLGTNGTNLGKDSPLQFCSIERIYSRVFEDESKSRSFNTDSELDRLFDQSRGPLMKRNNFTTYDSHLEQFGDTRPDQRALIGEYYKSFHWFYGLSRDFDGAPANITSDAYNFHRRMFSLRNILDQFLNDRSPGTLWDSLTGFSSRAREGFATGGDMSYQFLPLANHYERLFENLHSRIGSDRNEAGFAVMHAINVHPFKDSQGVFHMFHGQGPDGFERQVHTTQGRRAYFQQLVVNQPGFCALAPRWEDIANLRKETFRYSWGNRENDVSAINHHLWPTFISQDSGQIVGPDLHNWWTADPNDSTADTGVVSNGAGWGGLRTDGVGRDYVNYNKIPYLPFREHRSSLYYADSHTSWSDLEVFIKTAIRNIMLESLTEISRKREFLNISAVAQVTFPDDPYDYFNYEEFFQSGPGGESSNINQTIITRLLEGGEDYSVDRRAVRTRGENDEGRRAYYANDLKEVPRFNFDNEAIFTTEYGAFEAISGVNTEDLENLIQCLIDMFDSLHHDLGSQVNFMTKNELHAVRNWHLIHAPFRALIISRFLKKIRKDGYTVRESLCLLSLVSAHGFAASTHQIRSTQRSHATELKEEWALACILFILNQAGTNPDNGLWQGGNALGYHATQVVLTILRTIAPVFGLNVGHSGSFDTCLARIVMKAIVWQNEGHEGSLVVECGDLPGVVVMAMQGMHFDWQGDALGFVRGLVRNSDPDRIISDVNLAYPTAMRQGIEEGKYPPGQLTPGTPDNNAGILQYLLDPESAWDPSVPGGGLGPDDGAWDLMGDIFRDAYDRFRAISTASAAQSAATVAGNFSLRNTNGRDMYARDDDALLSIKFGKIETFLEKLDFNLFYKLFFLFSTRVEGTIADSFPATGLDELQESVKQRLTRNRGNAAHNDDRSLRNFHAFPPLERSLYNGFTRRVSSKYIVNYLTSRYPSIDPQITDEAVDNQGPGSLERIKSTVNQVYDRVIWHSLHASPTGFHRSNSSGPMADALRHSSRGNKRALASLDRRFKDAFQRYSGIYSGMLNAAAINQGMLSGEIFDGLLARSSISQVARLSINLFPVEAHGHNNADEEFRTTIRDFRTIQNISEEFRSFRLSTDIDGHRNVFSVPISEVIQPQARNEDGSSSSPWSPINEGFIRCMDWEQFENQYKEFRPVMTEELLNSWDTKKIFEYIFPVKRYQAISTVFATSALAGYGSMTSIMQTPKASLSAIMNVASMNTKERNSLFNDFSHGDFYKSMLDNSSSNPESLSCFDLPFDEEFFKQFLDMLLELIKQFPSIFFRGIANVIDPAYKEMKIHYDACSIEKLNWSGVRGPRITHDARRLDGGLYRDPDKGNPKYGEYADILTTAPADLVVSILQLIASRMMSPSAWREFGRTVDRTVAYLYKGPLALLAGPFNFSIPCKDIDLGWEMKPYNTGRYGHPISPLTAIALSTPELKADKRLRERAGTCFEDYTPITIEENLCDPSEAEEISPFGRLPPPEEE